MDIKEVFDARPASVQDILNRNGTCFYIPAYQRPYTWDKNHLDDLISDITHGLSLLIRNKDAISFIGSVILIDDQRKETIDPIVKYQTPSKVFLVIDGQQRLTTLIIYFITLHRLINEKLVPKYKKPKNDIDAWIMQQANNTLGLLEDTFIDEQNNGEGIDKYYPKIVRSYEDKWSHTGKQSQYNSPIAFFIRSYIEFLKSQKDKKTKFMFSDLIKNMSEAFKLVNINTRYMENRTKEIISENRSEKYSTYNDFKHSKDLQKILFGDEFPDDLMSEDLDQKSIELIKLLILSQFVLKRVSLTEVIAKNEDYAFDMFESLNTTGEPLTPYETFKPKVISAEGHTKFEKSESKKYTDMVESHLNAFKSADKKLKETNAILIPFALKVSGIKLTKKFSDQRKFLADVYNEKCSDLNAKRSFLKCLAYTTEFIYEIWNSHERTNNLKKHGIVFRTEPELTYLCLQVLKESGHDITVPLLSKFYSYCRNKEGNKEKEINEFEKVIKIVTSFFILWRSSHDGTSGIDNKHRALFIENYGNSQTYDDSNKMDSKTVKDFYKTILAEQGLNNLDKWLEKLVANSSYKESKPMTRFMLLLSQEETEADKEKPGFVKEGRVNLQTFLTTECFNYLKTIEHIAPQTKTDSWDDTIYANEETIHTLGNLALLPIKENASLSNRSWEDKSTLFEILSTENLNEAEKLKSIAIKKGLKEELYIIKDIKNKPYLPSYKSLSNSEIKWDSEFINERTRNLGKYIFAKLDSWVSS